MFAQRDSLSEAADATSCPESMSKTRHDLRATGRMRKHAAPFKASHLHQHACSRHIHHPECLEKIRLTGVNLSDKLFSELKKSLCRISSGISDSSHPPMPKRMLQY